VVETSVQNTGLELSPEEILKQKALRALAELPPFSPILNRLMASLAGEDVSFLKLAELIEKDTVLAGNLLHVVNSALYARRGTINSVRHALSILGVDKLRNAVLGMSITRMWNQTRTPAGWPVARFNMHSSATAILSDMVAQRLPVQYPEGAFVAGLLHDVGRQILALGLPGEYQRILELRESGRPYLECEQEILGFTHAELSAGALAFWNLPEPIQTAVRYHHAPALDHSSLKPGEIALSAVVDAANQYVNSTGVSIMPQAGAGSADATALASLGIERDRMDDLLAEFEAEYNAMAQFFR
jgi:HD-like signal output (HDOD) protein